MVCPICITTAIVSQLPVLSAAVVSATGIKMAIDQRRPSGATIKDGKQAQKVSVMKVSVTSYLGLRDSFVLHKLLMHMDRSENWSKALHGCLETLH